MERAEIDDEIGLLRKQALKGQRSAAYADDADNQVCPVGIPADGLPGGALRQIKECQGPPRNSCCRLVGRAEHGLADAEFGQGTHEACCRHQRQFGRER